MRISLVLIFSCTLHLSFSQNAPIGATPAQADSFYFNNEWKKAIPIYEMAIKNGQKNGLIYYRLGFSQYQLDPKSDLAVNNFYQCLNKSPNPNLVRVATVALSKIYSVKNNMDSCLVTLKRAVSMGYANLTELETGSEFTNLRANHSYPKLHKEILHAAYPCMTRAEARWFDFWIGDWNAFITGTKNLAGISKIEKIAGDCAILENWSNVNTSFMGKSINFYNSDTKKWEQHWVGSDGGYLKFVNGEYKEDAMRFTFSRTNADGTVASGKFSFFNQGPNQVRQLSESSNDNGKSWVIDYDFTYIRKSISNP